MLIVLLDVASTIPAPDNIENPNGLIKASSIVKVTVLSIYILMSSLDS